MQHNPAALHPEKIVERAIKIACTVAEVIQELGYVPSGHLYVMVQGSLSLDNYNGVIFALKERKWIEESRAHMLRWTGPAIGADLEAEFVRRFQR
jgi:hypothetical protein